MKKHNNPLPFDARNEEDFSRVTESIHTALARIETDHKIPATSEKLAELSCCTRKTLYNRGWPVERLRQIKAARKAAKEDQLKERRGYYEDAEGDTSSEAALISRIETLQKENGSLFERVQSLEEQLNNKGDIVNALEQDNKVLREANFELQGKMRINAQAVNSNVIELNSRFK